MIEFLELIWHFIRKRQKIKGGYFFKIFQCIWPENPSSAFILLKGPTRLSISKTIKNILLGRPPLFYLIKSAQSMSIVMNYWFCICVLLYFNNKQDENIFVFMWQGQKYTCIVLPVGHVNFPDLLQIL